MKKTKRKTYAHAMAKGNEHNTYMQNLHTDNIEHTLYDMVDHRTNVNIKHSLSKTIFS